MLSMSYSCVLFITLGAYLNLGIAIKHGSKNSDSSTEEELQKESSASTSSIQDAGIEITGPIWIPKNYRITCCFGGHPTVEDGQYARNFSYQVLDYVIEEPSPYSDAESNCRVFHGKYYVPPNAAFTAGFIHAIVSCKCPELGQKQILDRNCRKLPDCKNDGILSVSGRRCLCKDPFFGDSCERFCDQGRRTRGSDGRDYCNCIPLFRGEECRDAVCLHGGREENGRCLCPPQYLGYHCEIDTNKTGLANAGSRYQRFGDQSSEMFTRDISGTIFSLIMIVVLVVSMYLLMKHRMVQTRYLNRRPDLLGACNFPTSPVSANCLTGRRADLITTDDPRVYPFRPIPTVPEGPPPYIPYPSRGRRNRNESLPPLPTYEDATKLPPLRHDQNGDEDEVLQVNEDLEGPLPAGVLRSPSGNSLLDNSIPSGLPSAFDSPPLRPSTSASGSSHDSTGVEAPNSEHSDRVSTTVSLSENLDRESSIRRSI